jgi:hypothetical protein
MTKYFYTKYRYIEDNLWTTDTYHYTTTTHNIPHTTHHIPHKTPYHDHNDTGTRDTKGGEVLWLSAQMECEKVGT